MKRGKAIVAAVLSIVLALGLSPLGAAPRVASADTGGNTATANAYSGTYMGSVADDGYVSYRNITYATAERWQEAVPVGQSDQTVDATGTSTTIPYQNVRGGQAPQMSESELKLDIYTSTKGTSSAKPVLVCVNYGGGTSSNSNGADFSELLGEYPDLVIVNVNMRVAYFGCIDLAMFPDYDQYGDKYAKSNNLSRTDFVDALAWVNQNISAFGGDPENVTLEGASGGAVMAGTPLIIPDACQYVNKIIMSSGTPLDSISIGTMEEAENQTQEFINATGADTIEKALALTPEQINAAQTALSKKCIGAYYPGSQSKTFSNIMDNVVINDDYLATMQEQAQKHHISIMSITSDGEYDRDLSKKTLGLADDASDEDWSQAALSAIVKANWGKLDPSQGGSEKAPELIQGYVDRGATIGRDTVTSYKDLKNDINQKCSAVMICSLWNNMGLPAYLASYNYNADESQRGAHAASLRPVLGHISDTAPEVGSAWRQAIMSFVKYGDPNADNSEFSAAGVTWHSFDPYDHEQLVVDHEWGSEPISNVRWADINSLLPLFREYRTVYPPVLDRLAGNMAADTAAAIAMSATRGHGFNEQPQAIVVARDDMYYDALSAAGLAGALNAPILLTSGDSLSDSCSRGVQSIGGNYGVKDVYVAGGPNAVSDSVVSQIKDLGYNVKRVAGDDVYGTSMACTQTLMGIEGASSRYAIACNPTSFADAVSISGWAYANKVPVMLQTWGDTAAERGFTDEAAQVISGRELIVCGGKLAVSDESVNNLGAASITRLGGATLYDTSLAIANWELEHGMSAGNVCIASSIYDFNGVDALAASALAGNGRGVVLLANSNPAYEPGESTDMALSFIKDHKDEVRNIYVLGGTVASTPEFYDAVEAAMN